ncbi:hypothetical protein [Jiella marina]|uniref:hypothetical protein n=1 Tax=Jiella sp. LLJ827 TaxID=2917712 RepID=UPI0021006E31|nr:hypothetical protein [Jiella sp. LLJ827]MCQ0990349.1 hypothetical protein [Jiella sp. LLJ827]
MSVNAQNGRETLREIFDKSGAPAKKRQHKRRLAPFSLRLTASERQRLEQHAAAEGLPLGTYIKTKALDLRAPARRRRGRLVDDGQALAKALALLGRSDLSASLKELASAARIGALPVTPDLEAGLRQAVDHVGQIRAHLITALGLKTGSRA